jgi:ATP-binding cassette subfamily B protein
LNLKKPSLQRKVQWKRILDFFGPYRGQQVAVVVCIITVSLLNLAPPIISKWLIDVAIPSHSSLTLSIGAGGMVLTALLSAVVAVYQGYLNALVAEGIMRDMRTGLVGHLHSVPVSFFATTKTGEIMNRVSDDVTNVRNVIASTLVSVLSNCFTISFSIIAMVILDWRLAILALIIVPLMILPVTPVARKTSEMRKLMSRKRDVAKGKLQETLSMSGMVLIKSFVRESFERMRFYALCTDLMNLEIRMTTINRWFLAGINATIIVGPALIWLAGADLVVHHQLTVGTLVALVGFLLRLYGPASALAGLQVQIVGALAVFERVFEYLDLAVEESEENGPVLLSDARGEIEFEDVHFPTCPNDARLRSWVHQVRARRRLLSWFRGFTSRTLG